MIDAAVIASTNFLLSHNHCHRIASVTALQVKVERYLSLDRCCCGCFLLLFHFSFLHFNCIKYPHQS